MNQLAEVELQNELDTLRACASGQTFAEAPDVFKDIESTKVRLNVLRDHKHYEKLQAESAAKRARHVRRGVRS
jgi:hypothetical protein